MNEQSHPHTDQLLKSGEAFACFVDSIAKVSFSSFPDADYSQFHKSILYGIKKLSDHLMAELAIRQKQKIRYFIDANKDKCPALVDINLAGRNNQDLQRIFDLLYIDNSKPLHKRIAAI